MPRDLANQCRHEKGACRDPKRQVFVVDMITLFLIGFRIQTDRRESHGLFKDDKDATKG